MNIIEGKLNSVAAAALSNINELKRKRAKPQSGSEGPTASTSQLEEPAPQLPHVDLSAGIAFGLNYRDVNPEPPPIGWRPDLLNSPLRPQQVEGSSLQAPTAPTQYLSQSESSESLYEGDTWSKLFYLRVMLTSLIRLLVFVRKVYEDYVSAKKFDPIQPRQAQLMLLSIATLLLPTFTFTLYRVTRYLQISLPQSRSKTLVSRQRAISPSVAISGEEDGYGTARQTPTSLEESSPDGSSQVEKPSSTEASARSTGQLSKQIEQFKETVNVDKLGNLPDKETTRIAIGASEQLLHGILYLFWQLKRQVDVLAFLVERACLWRKPSDREKDELDRLQTGSDGLEWFQDFYSGFLAILLQLSMLAIRDPIEKSHATRSYSSPGQLVVSVMVLVSLLVAVRRRDDGPLTFSLSAIGWGCMFAARILLLILVVLLFGFKTLIAFMLIHVVLISSWIYKIAVDSHNGKQSENLEAAWVLEEGATSEPETRVTDSWSYLEHFALISQIVCLFGLPSLFYWPIMFNLKLHLRPFKYLVLIMSENFLFAVAIWLQNHYRVMKGFDTEALGPLWRELILLAVLSVVGFVFICFYVCCKPSLTEYFARADQVLNEAHKSGVYFEFCSRIFKMPDLGKESFRRLMSQQEKTVDVFELEVEREATE